MIRNYIYSQLEKFFIFLNTTILRDYKNWQWDRNTKPIGNIVTAEDYLKNG